MMRKYIAATCITFFFLLPLTAQADSIMLSATDFLPVSDSVMYEAGCFYLMPRSGSTVFTFVAPVHLPTGAKVTSVVVFYQDDHATANLGMYMVKVNAYTNIDTNMASWMSSGTSGGFTSHKISPIAGGNTINNGGYTYAVGVYFSSSAAGLDLRLYRIKINYK